jgi:hypothetical protein
MCAPMMHRTICRTFVKGIAMSLLFVSLASVTARQTEAARTLPKNRPDHGLIYDGLRRGSELNGCEGQFSMEDGSCTHGPDPVTPGRDMARRVEPIALPELLRSSSVEADCDAQDAGEDKRVQVVYVREVDREDRFQMYRASIQQWSALADDIFNLSAQQTGGSLRVRFARDASCAIDVIHAVVQPGVTEQFRATIAALRAQGHDRIDRKYLLFVDAAVYCGIAQTKIDDRPGVMNLNNLGSMFARVDAPCWGARVAAHELMHTMGGVQDSAPNSTFGIEGSLGGHCIDGSDIMCYADAANARSAMRSECPTENRLRFDCNNNDYFHTSPAADSYLATHYNAATNSFLIKDSPRLADPGRVTDDMLDSIEISAPALRRLFVPLALN